MAVRNVKYIVSMQDKLSKKMNKASGSANRLSSSVKRIGGALLAYFSVRAISNTIGKSIKAFNEQAQALAQVRQGLASTGAVSGKTFEELTRKAQELQSKTLFGDESILKSVTSQLLTFTNITGKNFDRTQQAILDVTSRVYGADAGAESLRSTAIQLGKALNDPVANLGALGRVGIQFTDQQKAQIKVLSKSNRIADAQTIILKELETQYGGSAKAAAKAGTGPFKQLQNQWGDINEEIGKRFVGGLKRSMPLFKRFTDLAQRFVRVPLSDELKKQVTQIKILRSRLSDSNISEKKRIAILEELKLINPKITEGIEAESLSYEALDKNIEKVVGSLKKKMMLDKINTKYQDQYQDFVYATGKAAEHELALGKMMVQIDKKNANSKLSFIDKLKKARKTLLAQKIAEAKADPEGALIGQWGERPKQRALRWFDWYSGEMKKAQKKLNKEKGFLDIVGKEREALKEVFNLIEKKGGIITPDEVIDPETKDILSKTFKAAAPKIFNINIEQMTGIENLNTQNIREGTGAVKEQVLIALTEALNEAQTIAQ